VSTISGQVTRVGGGTAERPCAGQKCSAQKFLSIKLSARLRDRARLTGVIVFPVLLVLGMIQLAKLTDFERAKGIR
jgi:hypothetical protein